MDNLERFTPDKLTEEVVNEINAMSYEEISELADIPGYFLIRDKSTNKPYTGQSTYRSLAVLHRLGHGKRFEVVGAQMNVTNSVAASTEEVNEIDDFIAPEQTIVDIENPDPEKDSTEGDSTEEEEIPEPEVNAPDEIISAPETEISLQNYSSEPVIESEIFPTEDTSQEEIVVDSKNEEPIQNATPRTEDLKPETGNESAAEVKATKSKRSK